MGNTLVVEGGTRDNSEVIASIVTSVTIPAGLAQSEVARGSLGVIPGGRRCDWDELGFAGWSYRTVPCQAV